MEYTQQISENQIKIALSNSGYLLENRLITLISEQDFFVFPNEVYKDKFTGKSREIDIYASSKRINKAINFSDTIKFIQANMCLVIECQNIAQPIVFLKKNQKNTFTCYDKYKYFITKLNSNVDSDILHGYLEFFIQNEEFHYNSKNISTQYCSFTQKKGGKNDWMASHPDGLYETFVKLFHFANERLKSTEDFRADIQFKEFYYQMLYPVLVIQGDIYDAEEVGSEIVLTRLQRKLFEFNYFDDIPHTILIDVVTESYFQNYLAEIENEANLFIKNFYEILQDNKV
ncbi:hypothetical protein [Lacibacter sp.]|uniref:hypothetical protein n=1 Tax=Lacibacter sp. TaxID=1915409 RepID=UPI002B4AD420|nr:hypothetical protein [Lacibacter sp.]HLP37733.1 hypothetical protein [Lacibacter sp.]